ncbi:MAG: hypothetical protein PHV34_02130 [Verrucomicrobiae bacterium]|nr:hypothetical protein [Verrucomicrobiae bacterium]
MNRSQKWILAGILAADVLAFRVVWSQSEEKEKQPDPSAPKWAQVHDSLKKMEENLKTVEENLNFARIRSMSGGKK